MLSQMLLRRSFSTVRVLLAQTDPCKIGMREIVGFGMNGQSIYIDTPMFPYPAIRFKEISPEFKALKEKEKGDWRSLTMEEKKALYRVSFCQTFAEMLAPTGHWKVVVGSVMMLISASFLLFVFMRQICYDPLPKTFDESYRRGMLRRMLAFRMNPIEGISSKWDYENDDWKK